MANGRSTAPFVVAHRAGNDLRSLQAAEAGGAALLEADVHLFRGRLELRHLKTLGPLPLLWDRWRLAGPWTRRPLLERALETLPARAELMLDLKTRDRRLPGRLLAVLGPHLPARRVTVCSRGWRLLEPFRDVESVRVVHSVGSRRQLRALRRRFGAGKRLAGLSVHERLLDAAVAAELRALAELVMAWPVNTAERASELLALGVDGLISDRPELLHATVLGEAAP